MFKQKQSKPNEHTINTTKEEYLYCLAELQ
jgi:hypothetical protein